MAVCVTQHAQRSQDLRIANLGFASAAEVTIQRLCDFILMGGDGTNEPVQSSAPLRRGRIGILSKRFTLADEQRFQS
jgi:hypothetical protein